MQIHWMIPAVMAAVVSVGLLLDLFLHDTKKPISMAKAGAWSAFWVFVSLCFAGWLYLSYGSSVAGLFLSGYVMEKALSIDNLMVFTAIFAYFHIKPEWQHKVLHYGILGAVVTRLIFTVIGTGSLLLAGPWVAAIFGVIVLWSAVKMFQGLGGEEGGGDVDYSQEWYVAVLGRYVPITSKLDAPNFLTHNGFIRMATPLLVCLVAVEISDVMFSFDSVPAVIAITQEPTLVYSAMLFAILGLRSLYFVLTALMRYLTELPKAVTAILFFIGAKLLYQAVIGIFHLNWPEISAMWSLSVIGGLLAAGVIWSLVVGSQESVKEA